MKKVRILVILVLVAALVLAACATPEADPVAPDDNNDPVQEPIDDGNGDDADVNDDDVVVDTTVDAEGLHVTIFVGQPADEHGMELLNEQVVMFEELFPGNTLEIRTGDMTIEGGALTTMLHAGIDLPDIINTNSGPGRIGLLANAGVIQPLDEMYARNDWRGRISGGAMSLVTVYDGQIWEVPNTMDCITVWYNIEIFAEHGLTAPTTWDEFMAINEQLLDAGVEPLAVGGLDGFSVGWLFGNILQSVAGEDMVYQLTNSEIPWTTPEVVRAAEIFQGFVDQGIISDLAVSRGNQEALFMFLDGMMAMYFTGTWVIGDLYDNDMLDNVSTFTLPSYRGAAQTFPTSGLGNSWIVPAGITDTAAAELYVEFLLAPERAVIEAANPRSGGIFATTAFAESPVLNPPILRDAIASISGGAGFNPSVFIGHETRTAYFQNLQGLLAGLITPLEAMENIQVGQDLDREE